jgi:hypothetical protein
MLGHMNNNFFSLPTVFCIKIHIVDLHSNVSEPPSHLRDGGGGMYSGRPKYNVLKKIGTFKKVKYGTLDDS